MVQIITITPISDTLTKNEYIKLALKWAKTGRAGEAPIDGISWNGEDAASYGTGESTLSIIQHADIVSILRHDVNKKNSAVQDTEFTADFGQKLFSMRLRRSFPRRTGNRQAMFQPSSLISFLGRNHVFGDDGGLPVVKRPVRIGTGNADIFIRAAGKGSICMLPIVFVSPKEDGTIPVNMAKLSAALKGAAHIFVGKNPETVEAMRKKMPVRVPEDGGTGLYCQDGTYRLLQPKSKSLLEDTISIAFTYAEKSVPASMPSWKDVENMVLREKLTSVEKAISEIKNERDEAKRETEKIIASLEKEREKFKEDAASEAHRILDSFEEDMKKMQVKLNSLENENTALQCENTGLRARIGGQISGPLLIEGKEHNLYDGEIKDIILSALTTSLKGLPEGTRRADVLKDVIDANGYQRLGESKMEGIKSILKGSGKLSAADIAKLEELGFIMTKNSRHYKLVYYGDRRYQTVIGKTPSDRRAGINNAMEIIRSTL